MSVDGSGAFPIVTDQKVFPWGGTRLNLRQYRISLARCVSWPLSVVHLSPHITLFLVVAAGTLGSVPLAKSLLRQRPAEWNGLPYALCLHPATTMSHGDRASDRDARGVHGTPCLLVLGTTRHSA